ncbi:MAG: helix-turn-helix domain-containing protein [Alteromonadaceae bacterium]|nr:helix-turn-helix domain-containing protein [Alteromonadaceae bacterium]
MADSSDGKKDAKYREAKERKYRFLGEELKETRELAGIKASKMAKELGVHQSTLTRWEDGYVQIGKADYDQWYKICLQASEGEAKARGERLVDIFDKFRQEPIKMLYRAFQKS